MKKTIFVYIPIIIMITIGAVGVAIQRSGATVNTSAMAMNATATARNTSTMQNTPVPETATPTVGYIETIAVQETQARSAQLTLEANRIISAQITEHAKDQEIKEQELSVKEMELKIKQSEIEMTTAPIVITVNAQNIEAMRINETSAAAYPTNAKLSAQSDTYAKYSDSIKTTEIAFEWSVIFFLVVCSLAILRFLARTTQEPTKPTKQELINLGELQNKNRPAMVFEKAPDNTLRRINPIVPCSNSQLLELADGVINAKKSLAFGQWEGTEVHKRLAEIRAWMVGNYLAETIPNYRNELVITSKGEEFFIDALSIGEPPIPYKCRDVETKEEVKQPETEKESE